MKLCPNLSVVIFGALALACSGKKAEQITAPLPEVKGSVSKELYGTLGDGREVHLYTITNGKGLTVKAMNYGGIIASILTPDRNRAIADVVLGFNGLERYLERHPHMGPVIGRYSGYVAGAKFSIDDTVYELARNSGDNHLHGGPKGFDKALWNATEINTDEGPGIKLDYTSPDGEEGYPGNLKASITYVVADDNSLRISYEAETDKKTHVNLTNHTYFNLSGMETDNILQHELSINASHFAVPGKGNIPTGELKDVKGTPLDFRRATVIGSRIAELTNGYDHNYVLKSQNDSELILAATAYDPGSGRYMEVYTTHTGLEFASAGWLNVEGKGGKHYGESAGFLLYPQHLPDSPNRPDFPTTLLGPGERYLEKTVYKFSVK